MPKRIQVGKQNRVGEIKPNSYNAANRTIDVVFTTGKRGRRSSWFSDPYYEELAVDEKSMRMERLNNGAPVLNSHSSYGLNSILGVVESARIEKGQGIATIRFSKRADIQGIISDIQDNIIRNISVGYNVHKYEEIGRDEADEYKIFRATDWEPMEISFVSIPFDEKSQVRSEEETATHDCEVRYLENTQTRSEDKPAETPAETPPEDAKQEPAPKPAAIEDISQRDDSVEEQHDKPTNRAEDNSMDPEEIKRLAIEAERKRSADIRIACTKARMNDEFITAQQESGATIDEVRALIIDSLERKDEEAETVSHSVKVGEDLGRVAVRDGIQAAIHARFDSSIEIDANSKKFANRRMIDLARMSLEAAGVRDVMDFGDQRIAEMALRGSGFNSSSDFPLILENIVTKTLQKGYTEAPATWYPLARDMVVNDFKEVSRVHTGEFDKLEKVLEGGEYKNGKFSERGERYSIAKYGKKIAYTWEMMINDDMSALSTIPMKMGKKARDLESDIVWDLLISNTQVMAEDNIVIFHANHANLNQGSAGAVSETTLSAMRTAMRTQKDLDGTSPLNLFPAHIFVPAKREVETTKLLRSITPSQSSNVNVFGQDSGFSLTPHVEPRLDAVSNFPWFVTADINQCDMLEVARLRGNEVPSVTSREGFDVDGTEMKIRHLFVAHAIDSRGLQRNNGA